MGLEPPPMLRSWFMGPLTAASAEELGVEGSAGGEGLGLLGAGGAAGVVSAWLAGAARGRAWGGGGDNGRQRKEREADGVKVTCEDHTLGETAGGEGLGCAGAAGVVSAWVEGSEGGRRRQGRRRGGEWMTHKDHVQQAARQPAFGDTGMNVLLLYTSATGHQR
jgi:hypothetical protein